MEDDLLDECETNEAFIQGLISLPTATTVHKDVDVIDPKMENFLRKQEEQMKMYQQLYLAEKKKNEAITSVAAAAAASSATTQTVETPAVPQTIAAETEMFPPASNALAVASLPTTLPTTTTMSAARTATVTTTTLSITSRADAQVHAEQLLHEFRDRNKEYTEAKRAKVCFELLERYQQIPDALRWGANVMLPSITPETKHRIDELFFDSGIKLVKICREHCASQTAHLPTIREQAKERVCALSNQLRADVWSKMANDMAALKDKSEVEIQKATAKNEKAILRWTNKGRKEKND